MGLFADFEHAGRWELQASYRDRVNHYLLGYTPLAPVANQQSAITSRDHELQLRCDLDLQAFGQTHTIGVGLQSLSGQYARYANGRTVPEQSQPKARDGRFAGPLPHRERTRFQHAGVQRRLARQPLTERTRLRA